MAGQRMRDEEPQARLEHNDFFRSRAEPRMAQAVVASVLGAAGPDVRVSSLGAIPIAVRSFIGADMAELSKEDWRALRAGSPMVVLEIREGSPPSVRHMAIGSADRLGLGGINSSSSEGLPPGSLPAIESRVSSLISEAGRRGNPLEIGAIFITRPLDCLQFVNNAVEAAGGRPVLAQSGKDLSSALAVPGAAIVGRVDDIIGSAFFSSARQGDVVLFLRQLDITAGDTQMIESTSGGDHVIWIGDDGRLIPRSRIEELARTDPDSIPGRAYQVRHSAVFGGIDRRTGRPLVAQSHIASGNLSVEPLDQYIRSYGAAYHNFDAVAVISLEFFAPNRGAIASR